MPDIDLVWVGGIVLFVLGFAFLVLFTLWLVSRDKPLQAPPTATPAPTHAATPPADPLAWLVDPLVWLPAARVGVLEHRIAGRFHTVCGRTCHTVCGCVIYDGARTYGTVMPADYAVHYRVRRCLGCYGVPAQPSHVTPAGGAA